MTRAGRQVLSELNLGRNRFALDRRQAERDDAKDAADDDDDDDKSSDDDDDKSSDDDNRGGGGKRSDAFAALANLTSLKELVGASLFRRRRFVDVGALAAESRRQSVRRSPRVADARETS